VAQLAVVSWFAFGIGWSFSRDSDFHVSVPGFCFSLVLLPNTTWVEFSFYAAFLGDLGISRFLFFFSTNTTWCFFLDAGIGSILAAVCFFSFFFGYPLVVQHTS